MKNIFVVGSINTDLVISTPYLPKAGETLTGSGFFVASVNAATLLNRS